MSPQVHFSQMQETNTNDAHSKHICSFLCGFQFSDYEGPELSIYMLRSDEV